MIDFNLEITSTQSSLPTEADFYAWICAVLSADHPEAEISIRIIDAEESAALNTQYRNKSGPTNVLAFTLETAPLVGDIAICAPLVIQEAQDQEISETAHWAHLTVHACYHLLGYDHQSESEAAEMEALEITTLQALGYDNPYGDESHD